MSTGSCDHEPRNDEDNIPTPEELHIPCKCGEAIKNTYLLELPNGDRSNFSYIEKKDKTPIIKVIDGIRYLVIKWYSIRFFNLMFGNFSSTFISINYNAIILL